MTKVTIRAYFVRLIALKLIWMRDQINLQLKLLAKVAISNKVAFIK
ncbi:protein of unknown function [Vibrio tapetis subsp. tapetis]|uniref:Uncharacterized protein n=1 Tax=Vibrio tapetis subsp. tapetis TaxID=1671868 RepID=A0A2N8ZKP7_9VIBR|nr:protein of unknown function [Vibrio tapetis subsp. tapetis]